MRNAILLIIIICLAAFLRIYDLGKQSIWLDEAAAFNRANKTPVELLRGQISESNPPVYDILLHYFLKLTNQRDEFSLRLLSAILGIAAVFLGFWMGRAIFNSSVGLWFSFLLSFSPYHIYYSQDAKMYALVSLLSMLSVLFYYLAIDRDKPLYPIIYVLTTVLIIYSHSFGIFLFISQCVVAAYFYKSLRSKSRLIFASLSLILAAAIPRICIMIYQFSNNWNPHIKFSLFPDSLKILPQFSFLGWRLPETPLVEIALAAGMPVVLFILYSAVSDKRGVDKQFKTHILDSRGKIDFLVINLASPIALVMLISLIKPVYVPGRYDMIVYPIFPFLLSIGLYKIRKKFIQAICLMIIVCSTAVCLRSYYRDFKKSNDREIFEYIKENSHQDDLFIFTFLTLPAFSYYSGGSYRGRTLEYPRGKHNWLSSAALNAEEKYVFNEINKIKSDILLLQKKGARIWVIYGDLNINSELIRELRKEHKLDNVIRFDPGGNDVQASRIYIFYV